MASVKPALNRGEGLAHVWEEVFLEVDSKLDTEDGTTATAVLVWRDLDDNVCLQVLTPPSPFQTPLYKTLAQGHGRQDLAPNSSHYRQL